MSSQYRNKSIFFLDSAEILLKNYYYVAVPHCAYYSCYQIIKVIWLDVMGNNDQDIENMIIAKNVKTGSHNFLIEEILKFSNSILKDPNECRSLRNGIHQLKTLRTKSDYEDESITYDIGKKAIDLAKDILVILNKIK